MHCLKLCIWSSISWPINSWLIINFLKIMFRRVDHLEMLFSIIFPSQAMKDSNLMWHDKLQTSVFLGFGRWGRWGLRGCCWGFVFHTMPTQDQVSASCLACLGCVQILCLANNLYPGSSWSNFGTEWSCTFHYLEAFLFSNSSSPCCAQYRAFCPKRHQRVLYGLFSSFI